MYSSLFLERLGPCPCHFELSTDLVLGTMPCRFSHTCPKPAPQRAASSAVSPPSPGPLQPVLPRQPPLPCARHRNPRRVCSSSMQLQRSEPTTAPRRSTKVSHSRPRGSGHLCNQCSSCDFARMRPRTSAHQWS